MLQMPLVVEISNDDYVDSYEELLNDTYGDFMNMDAAYILKECDPVAYRCGLNDYVYTLDIEEKWECQSCWKQHDDEEDALRCCTHSIEIEGHIGTWYVIKAMSHKIVGGEFAFLLEHEEYGDEVPCLIVDCNYKIIADEIWNGFGDLDDLID